MNEVEQAQQDLIDEFRFFDDWMDRYQYIIDLGQRLPPFPTAAMTDKNKIRGCQSQVWFLADWQDDRLHFQAVSDAAGQIEADHFCDFHSGLRILRGAGDRTRSPVLLAVDADEELSTTLKENINNVKKLMIT